MGHEYMQCVVCGNLSGLSPTAFRILARMAAVVRDQDAPGIGEPEGIYFGGWKGLTAVLGYGIYERDDELPSHVHKRIQRGIRELRDAGYISTPPDRIQREYPTRVYRLNIARIPII